MNFKQFGVSKNVMPSANAETKSNNGITISCDGEGRYYIKGTATASVSIYFEIESFTVPVSVGSGESGTFSMFNDFYASGTATGFYLYNNSTQIDVWRCTSKNRTTIAYSAMGGKTINRIRFTFESGFVVDGVMSPMFTNDGQLPAEFEPHMVWHDIPHYIHNTSTDTITTLPAVVYANDTTATVELKGNMEQSGTPTPTTPIQPSECGERAAQIIPYPYYQPDAKLQGVTWTTSSDGKIIGNGTTTGGTNFVLSTNLALPVGMYTLQVIGKQSGMSLMLYDTTASVLLARIDATETTSSVTFEIAQTGAHRLYFNTGYADRNVNIDCFVMVNTGSTALPYEPYGYKIPILSNSTTTPVYLGEVESTRRIKKLVLTGTENWSTYNLGNTNTYFYHTISDSGISNVTPLFCSNFTEQNIGSTTTDVGIMILSSQLRIRPENADTTTKSDFLTYLQQQYANGTPITVWYVLAEPTTGIVNEPLRKIGDYADTVSGITIPTIAGANTLSIGTTLQPSEVTVNYKGWHPVQSVHERDNGAWT